MTDEEQRDCEELPERVSSPCTGVCMLDAKSGLCEGCARTIEEIAGWSSASDAEREAILGQVARRHPLL